MGHVTCAKSPDYTGRAGGGGVIRDLIYTNDDTDMKRQVKDGPELLLTLDQSA